MCFRIVKNEAKYWHLIICMVFQRLSYRFVNFFAYNVNIMKLVISRRPLAIWKVINRMAYIDTCVERSGYTLSGSPAASKYIAHYNVHQVYVWMQSLISSHHVVSVVMCMCVDGAQKLPTTTDTLYRLWWILAMILYCMS